MDIKIVINTIKILKIITLSKNVKLGRNFKFCKNITEVCDSI